MDEIKPGEWLARVVKKEDDTTDGKVLLEAKLNPKLSATERTHLACVVSAMYANLGAEGVLGLTAELKKVPRVLRP